MIYYLLDFFINNLNLYTSSLVLIRLDKFDKYTMLHILLIDILINRIPIIFIILIILKFINKYLRNLLTKSFFVDNLIFIFNYLIFMSVIFIYRISDLVFLDLIWFYLNNFFINYFLFLWLKYNCNNSEILI